MITFGFIKHSKGRLCVPVIAEIVSEDAQQCVSKLGQSDVIVLDPSQMVEQRLGRKLHLNGSNRGY